MIVGAYTLDLYCEAGAEERPWECTASPGQFVGRSEIGCIRLARSAGWRVAKGKTPDVACPNHRRRRRRADPPR